VARNIARSHDRVKALGDQGARSQDKHGLDGWERDKRGGERGEHCGGGGGKRECQGQTTNTRQVQRGGGWVDLNWRSTQLLYALGQSAILVHPHVQLVIFAC
jgi:hypothetical protein